MLTVLLMLADTAPSMAPAAPAAAMTPPVLAPPIGPSPAPHVYLHPPADECDSRSSSNEVVVCGNRAGQDAFRLHPVDDRLHAEKPVRAETKLGAGTLALHTDEVKVGNQLSKRAMVTFKLPF